MWRSLYRIFANVAIGFEYHASFITRMILSNLTKRNNLNAGLKIEMAGSIDSKSMIAIKVNGYIQKDFFPFFNLMSAVIHRKM